MKTVIPIKQIKLKHCLDGVPGLVDRFSARKTGAMISIYCTAQAGLPGKSLWTVKCETHGDTVGADKIAMANYYRTNPDGWCEGCLTIVEKKGAS